MPCPYKEGSEYCWLCWNWNEYEEYCILPEEERQFQLIDEFKDIDPKTYNERMQMLKDMGLIPLHRAVKAGFVKQQRSLSDFGVEVMRDVENRQNTAEGI